MIGNQDETVTLINNPTIKPHWYAILKAGILKIMLWNIYPGSKVHGANVGPIWDWQDRGGPYVGPLNFAIWVLLFKII